MSSFLRGPWGPGRALPAHAHSVGGKAFDGRQRLLPSGRDRLLATPVGRRLLLNHFRVDVGVDVRFRLCNGNSARASRCVSASSRPARLLRRRNRPFGVVVRRLPVSSLVGLFPAPVAARPTERRSSGGRKPRRAESSVRVGAEPKPRRASRRLSAETGADADRKRVRPAVVDLFLALVAGVPVVIADQERRRVVARVGQIVEEDGRFRLV